MYSYTKRDMTHLTPDGIIRKVYIGAHGTLPSTVRRS